MRTLPKTYLSRLQKNIPLAVEDYWEFRTLGPRHTPASCAKWLHSMLALGWTSRQWEMWELEIKQATYDLVQEYYAQHKPEFPEADHKNEFCPRFLAWQEHLRTEYGLSDEVVTLLDQKVRFRMWDGQPFERATGDFEQVLKAVLP